MGRLKKLLTNEQKNEAQKKYCKTYYERNKDILNKASMKKYYANKKSDNLQDDKLS